MPTYTSRTGCLLINLGTPDSPNTPDVRVYLKEFLSDPRVVDLPALGRWLLLNAVILPFRPAKSGKAYRTIWSDAGSPLLMHCRALQAAVQERLGPEIPVELGMRYGRPSIKSALEALRDKGVDRIVVLPLYPHNASSSTGSSLELVYRELGTWWDVPALSVVEPFYDDPGFIAAWKEISAPILDAMQPDHVLFSFHGLPERHLSRSVGGHPICEGECGPIGPSNRNCYRGQSFTTARALAETLSLPADTYSVSFQSRLGTTPWIRPFTDEVLVELAKKGVKRLAVFSPAFTADCLETLEEIGMRAKETFLEHGGEDLQLIPSLNATPRWVDAVLTLLAPHLPTPQPALAPGNAS
ncbi:Ferrochelatase [compost metagenome]